jgi:hypothetical protein
MKKIGLLCGIMLVCYWHTEGVLAQSESVIINEIHCEAAAADGRTEYIEIYNKSASAVDLSGWQLDKGLRFTFAKGSTLGVGEYAVVAQDVAALRKKYALALTAKVWGNYAGKLKASGDKIELRNAKGETVDNVSYELGFPYPTVSKENGTTLQLMHPELSRKQAAHWRSAPATPAAVNHANILLPKPDAPPSVNDISHSPKQPKTGQEVYIKAKIKDKQGIAKADVLYQVVAPGAYIRLKDAAFEQPRNWVAVSMNDEGKDGDEKAGDGIFTARMPAVLQKHRHLLRYRIVATDVSGNSVRVPYSDDPQPNFAYFVFDTPAPYLGKYDFAKVQPLPICQLIAKQEDANYNINTYRGDSYKNTGTIVYNGEVYDHIGFRSRGYANRHARRKRNLKFNFTRGHDIETLDNYGQPYKVKRGKWVLSGTWLLNKPNTHGVAEGVLYKLFNLQGAPATYSDYVHLRVVTHANESDSTAGDFWGLYMVMENFDKDFLKTHDLPQGNIYAYKPPKMRYQLPDTLPGLTNPIYKDWDANCEKPNTLEWWRTHLDLRAYFAFVASQEAINNRETGYRKQHWWMEYHNPKNNNWAIFPWDMDATWTTTSGKSTISGAIRKAAFSHLPIEIEYHNHLRSFLDLLYNAEQMNQLIDEYANFIYDEKAAYSFALLDKLRWGHDYKHSFSQEIQQLKRFATTRADILRAQLPRNCPATPALTYAGAPNYLIDQLVFTCSDYRDTSQFAAMQWQLAEVTDRNNPFYAPQFLPHYEINAIWESGEITVFDNKISIPYGVALPNRSYRLRVRFKNKLGYYSHWSPPIQFIAAMPKADPRKKIIFTEALYNANKNTNLEFVELKNISESPIQLKNYQIKGGISYDFKTDITLAPNAYLLLTNDTATFSQTYLLPAQAQFKGKLNNKGETIILCDPAQIVVDSLAYPPIDKVGFSLERVVEKADAYDWQISPKQGGSPNMPLPIINAPIDTTIQIAPPTPTPAQKAVNEFSTTWQLIILLIRLAIRGF